mmetsp:Transcript_15738/g.30412  ORF Transcript_15738/g.30412 Transcript_15738/m.30412 type:complete len:570 (-) Transcript_15738:345-2054(-)
MQDEGNLARSGMGPSPVRTATMGTPNRQIPQTPPAAPRFTPSAHSGSSSSIKMADLDSGEEVRTGISIVELQKLQKLSKETTEKLHSVWDEMGLSPEERSLQLNSLLEAVETVFTQKVSDEVLLRDEYISAAASLEQEIDALSQVLGMERQFFPHEDKGNLMIKLTWLRSHLAHFQNIRDERMAKLEEMHTKLHEIRLQMGEHENKRMDDLEAYLTQDGMDEYESSLIEATHQKPRRIAAIQETIRDITALFEELEYDINDDIDKAIVEGGEGLGIDMDAVAILSQRARELTDEKISRTERLKQLGSQIQPLWERLEIDTDTRQKFFMDNRGLGLGVIRQCELELERLLHLKHEKMGELIQTAQMKIQELWDEMQFDDEQREAFTHSHMMAPICEDTLIAHEEEIAVLNVQAELYRPILKAVERYKQLCEERDEYEARIQDSSRLLSRKGGNALREEEAQRRRVTQGLPRTVEKIKITIAEYEAEHGPFVLNGRRFIETMDDNEEDHARQLEENKLRKKNKSKEGKEDVLPGSARIPTRTPSKKPIPGTPSMSMGSTPRARPPLGSRNY